MGQLLRGQGSIWGGIFLHAMNVIQARKNHSPLSWERTYFCRYSAECRVQDFQFSLHKCPHPSSQNLALLQPESWTRCDLSQLFGLPHSSVTLKIKSGVWFSAECPVLIDVKALHKWSHRSPLAFTDCLKLAIGCSKPIIFFFKASNITNKSQPNPQSL